VARSEIQVLDQSNGVVVQRFDANDRCAGQFAFPVPAMVIANAPVTIPQRPDLRLEHTPVRHQGMREHDRFRARSLLLDTQPYAVRHHVAD
jgi:hypothetical protein